MKLQSLYNRPWILALICTIFICYPNIAWMSCEFEYCAVDRHFQFFLGFFLRFFYLLGVTYFLIRYNLEKISDESIVRRLYVNIGVAAVAGLIYKGAVMLLNLDFDRFISILVFQYLVLAMLGFLIGYISYLYAKGDEKDRELDQLRIENLQSRCNALVNQINPHFFFNSLNSISSLVRKKDDRRTLDYITELSDVFRYILQSEHKGLVSLADELDFVEAFKSIMEVRFANKISFEIDVPDEVKECQLPVLSLLPLLENVTVHNTIDSDHLMTVKLTVNEAKELVVSNNRYPRLQPAVTHGTGQRNLSNRFKLLKGKDIRVEITDDKYIVYLPLI